MVNYLFDFNVEQNIELIKSARKKEYSNIFSLYPILSSSSILCFLKQETN